MAGGERVGTAFEPRVWRSVDGRSWEGEAVGIDSAERTTFNVWGSAFMALGGGSDGWVGSLYRDAVMLLVRSSDASSWVEVPLPADPPEQDRPPLELLAEHDGTVVAATDGYEPLLLRVRGQEVERLSEEPLPLPGDVLWANQLIAVGDEVVVVGGYRNRARRGEDAVGAAVWRLGDDGTVARVDDAPFADAFASAAMVAPDGALVLV